jgi:molybdate transport system substrate-binding protein
MLAVTSNPLIRVAAFRRVLPQLLGLLLLSQAVSAETLKVLTAGAVKPAVNVIVPGFQSRTGVQVLVESDTAGALLKRIQSGEIFDVAFLTSAGIKDLTTAGKVNSATTKDFARIGIGIAIRSGAMAPKIGTVEEFKAAILSARKVAYIDPTAGGSSGIYMQGLFQRLGLAEAIKPKALLVPGGLTASKLVSGEADLAIQQSSELMTVEGATLIGMLPESIQNYTIYAFGVAADSRMHDVATQFLGTITGPAGTDAMRKLGIQPVQ